MLEVGARFSNTLYTKLSFDPVDGVAFVSLEIINNEGEVQTITGTVTWDEDGSGRG